MLVASRIVSSRFTALPVLSSGTLMLKALCLFTITFFYVLFQVRVTVTVRGGG
jgi:uncharacterized membrane protein YqhA